MGDMADWAFDQMLADDLIEWETRQSLLNDSNDDLVQWIEWCLSDVYYEENRYTDMICNIYMSHQSGYILTDKQRYAIVTHVLDFAMRES